MFMLMSVAVLAAICNCEVCPERENDFVWENDQFGMRAYGPGEWHKWSGFDVFNKNTPENVCLKWCHDKEFSRWDAKPNFHVNLGQGMDNYTMGASRGVGGIAMFADGEWKTYPNWETNRVIHTGDDYLEFELVYPAFSAAGKMTCHITLKRGERFFRNDVSFERDLPPGGVAGPGLDLEPKRDHAGNVFFDPAAGVVSLYEKPKGEQGKDGSTMSALFAAPGQQYSFRTDHLNCRVLAFTTRKFSYYAGAYWSLAGEIKTANDWHNHVREFLARVSERATGLPTIAETHGDADGDMGVPELVNRPAEGFRGIWYYNQKLGGEYVYKYSGGMGAYCAGHIPMSVYAPHVGKTFFCFGGTTPGNTTLLQCVSYFDHKTKQLARPVAVYDKHTIDAHDNAVLNMDDRGYLFLFSSSHGKTRPSAIARSKRPYDISEWETIWTGNYSYPQPFFVKGKGFLFLHTCYQGVFSRRSNYVAVLDPTTGKLSDKKQVCFINQGNYLRSWQAADGRIGVSFDQHPNGKPGIGLNWRTDLYYIETRDGGETWVNAAGENVALPITERENKALVFKYAEKDRNVYIKGVKFDRDNRPIIVYIVSKGYASGPENGPRQWKIARFDGKTWHEYDTGIVSDNNYDYSTLFVGEDDTLRLIGASEKGPQPFNPGGEIAVWISKDGGKSWAKEKDLTRASARNQNYPRQAIGGTDPGFLTFWADGDGRKPSISRFYFCDRDLNVFRMPLKVDGAFATPEPMTDDSLTVWLQGKDPETINRRLSELFLSVSPDDYLPIGYYAPPEAPDWARGGYGNGTYIQYSTVSLWVNALENARTFGDRELEQRLVAAFDPYLGPKAKMLRPIKHVDLNVVGAVPLAVARLSGNAKAKEVGLALADFQWREPREDDELFWDRPAFTNRVAWWKHGYSDETRLWIDDMYMINLLQTQAYKLTGDKKYVDRAAKEMCLYLDRIQRPDGLFNHAPDVPFVWGRGAGWMAAGMPLVLECLTPDHPCYARILAGYRKMMATLLKHQRPSGLWGQLVDDAGSWDETSGSAMFAYGFATGIRHGWLDRATYAPAVRKAWLALCDRLDVYGNLADVCVGTNKKNDRDYYLARPKIKGDPHGQAPLLWLAGALANCNIMLFPAAVSADTVTLSNRYGKVEVSTFGAQVLSYVPTGGSDLLFMPPDRDFTRDREMHGGIPVCWPWFGRCGEPGSRLHGLARFVQWQVAERVDGADCSRLVLTLESSDATRKVWPYDFKLRYELKLAERLTLTLESENTGTKPFKVTQGFHPYFRVADPAKVVVKGLAEPLKAYPGIDGGHPKNAMGRYSFNVNDRGGSVFIEAEGETKLVVWNPGDGWDGWKPDCNIVRTDWPKFLCVEPAVLGRENAVEVPPGGRNRLMMSIWSALDDASKGR